MTSPYTARRRHIAELRLAAQHIAVPAAPTAPSVADTVRHLLAVQAQDFAGAKWSVGLRTPGATETDVVAALASGEIVRSWPMRGTLHFVAADDLGWMLSLTSTRIVASTAGRHRALELTERDLAVAADAAVAALSGGRVLDRAELLAVFQAADVATTGQRGAHLLMHLALTGVIVFGPVRDKQQTFALLDEWVTAPRRLEHDEALREFAERYFRGHGPATVRDFAWWSSLTLRDARLGVELARDLETLDLDGITYYVAAAAEPVTRDAHSAHAHSVYALPGFDEYLLGYQDRGAALDPSHFELVVPGKNGLFLSTIVVDGEVVATWRRSVTARGVRVELAEFAGASSDRTGIRPEAGVALSAYARFLGLPLLPLV